MGVGGLLKDFSGWTSSHGIPLVGAAKNKVIRITWAIICLGSLAMFGYQLSVIIIKFYKYGVTVATEVRSLPPRQDPNRVVCKFVCVSVEI